MTPPKQEIQICYAVSNGADRYYIRGQQVTRDEYLAAERFRASTNHWSQPTNNGINHYKTIFVP